MTSDGRTWYLGGPMTGYADFNFPAFAQAAAKLRNDGWHILSAHEVDHGEHTGTGTQPYEDYLKGDLRVLLQCDGAIFLQGWPESKGARLEFDIAADLGYPIVAYEDDPRDYTITCLSRPEKF